MQRTCTFHRFGLSHRQGWNERFNHSTAWQGKDMQSWHEATQISHMLRHATSCYVMLRLCRPLHITCTLWDACHTCHACVACSVWLTKFWTGQGQDIQVVEDLEEPGSLKASCNDHAMWRPRSKKLWPSLTNGNWMKLSRSSCQCEQRVNRSQ